MAVSRARHVGRNEACPCGSGTKFKRCCGGSRTIGVRERVVLMVLIGVVLAAILVGIASFRGDAGSTVPQRVWSEEHGHWHTVP